MNLNNTKPFLHGWPHSPPHRILESGTYIITAGTYNKENIILGQQKLSSVFNELLSAVDHYCVTLSAWAILSNHYHIIVTIDSPESLRKLIASFQRRSSTIKNKLDNSQGRKVWYNFWDSSIDYEKSYYARLNYVNKNPQFHGIVRNAEEYEWCSEAYYKCHADPVFRKTLDSFKFDRLKIIDDF